MSTLEKDVVVITGASGGVGSALVQRFAQKSPLALIDAHPQEHQQLPAGAKALSLSANLIDEADVHKVFERVRNELGTVRALVHTVGGYADGHDVVDQPLATLRGMFDLNVVTAANVVKAALPDLLESPHGRIVLFASADALHGRAGASAYAASKAALLRFGQALSEEVADKRVGVRVLLPSTIDTPRNRTAMPDANHGNWVTLDEVANAVEFLIAPASSGLRYAEVRLGR